MVCLLIIYIFLNILLFKKIGAFRGTRVNSLGLAVNQFTTIETGWFEGIVDTLEALYLYANFLTSNPAGDFRGVRKFINF
jgi:hypothetical protein